MKSLDESVKNNFIALAWLIFVPIFGVIYVDRTYTSMYEDAIVVWRLLAFGAISVHFSVGILLFNIT